MHRVLSLGILSVAALAGLGGCASIVNGQNQSLSVTTRRDGTDINGAKCALNNNKGTWYVTTPGSVTVHRSYEDMAVTCTLDDWEPGTAAVKSSTKGMAFGNILLGGVIGAGVDISTGAAYDYPEVIVVTMGSKKASAPTASTTATSPAAATATVATAAAAAPTAAASAAK